MRVPIVMATLLINACAVVPTVAADLDLGARDAGVIVERDATSGEYAFDVEVQNDQELIALDIPLSFGEPSDPITLVRVDFSPRLAGWEVKHALIDNREKTVMLGCISSLTGDWDNVRLRCASKGVTSIATLVFKIEGKFRPTITAISAERPTRTLSFIYNKNQAGKATAMEFVPEFSRGTSFKVPAQQGGHFLPSNVPNPFNPSTTIHYSLEEDAIVRLEVFNILGQQVRSLVSGASQTAGAYEVLWDGCDDRGAKVGSGVYLYRLRAGEFEVTNKMIMLK